MHGLSNPAKELALYEHCLDDTDARIRELSLIRLLGVQRARLKPLASKIRQLVIDPRPRVRQAATRLVHYIDAITLAKED